MSEKKLRDLNSKMEAILGLSKAPSQNIVFIHLLGTGKTQTVGEISSEVGLTAKATERAVAKLVGKELIQRAPFRARSYYCDNKEILLGLLVTVQDLRDRLNRKGF